MDTPSIDTRISASLIFTAAGPEITGGCVEITGGRISHVGQPRPPGSPAAETDRRLRHDRDPRPGKHPLPHQPATGTGTGGRRRPSDLAPSSASGPTRLRCRSPMSRSAPGRARSSRSEAGSQPSPNPGASTSMPPRGRWRRQESGPSSGAAPWTKGWASPRAWRNRRRPVSRPGTSWLALARGRPRDASGSRTPCARSSTAPTSSSSPPPNAPENLGTVVQMHVAEVPEELDHAKATRGVTDGASPLQARGTRAQVPVHPLRLAGRLGTGPAGRDRHPGLTQRRLGHAGARPAPDRRHAGPRASWSVSAPMEPRPTTA